MLVESLPGSTAGFSEEEKSAIHLQLERLLASTYFSHSRRFPSFLRFAIDHTLSGQSDFLKERSLGIEIFGKNADYDTASDPIVRVTAAEIRKRIAQYYQDPGRENELRISLPTGSYVPHFQWPHTGKVEGLAPASRSVLLQSPIREMPEKTRLRTPGKRWLTTLIAACALLVIAALAATTFGRSAQQAAFDRFWGPVLSSNDPVLLCIADQNQYSVISLRDAADPSHLTVLPDNLTAVVMDDLSPIVRVAGLLQAHGKKKYTLKGEDVTTLADLQSGPTVFIGAFDNQWTLRLTKPLRYHFANTPGMTQFRITDSNAPAQTSWTVNRSQQMATNNYRDYAIVARFTDNDTGRIAVLAAGIGRGGTIAAGEFLADPGDLALLKSAAQAAGNKKNMEVVLSTQIIGGEPGTPKLEASYFW